MPRAALARPLVRSAAALGGEAGAASVNGVNVSVFLPSVDAANRLGLLALSQGGNLSNLAARGLVAILPNSRATHTLRRKSCCDLPAMTAGIHICCIAGSIRSLSPQIDALARLGKLTKPI